MDLLGGRNEQIQDDEWRLHTINLKSSKICRQD